MFEPDRIEAVGVTLQREVKPAADWTEFVASISGVGVDAVTKTPLEALSGSVSALVKLALSLRMDVSAGERAYYLCTMAFAWATAQTTPITDPERPNIFLAVKEAIKRADRVTETEGIFIPANFADRPSEIPLYRKLKESLIAITNNGNDHRILIRIAKLDAAFASGIYAIWAAKPEAYRSIAEAVNSPGRAGAEAAIAWEAYRRKLVFDFDAKPTFGQEEGKLSLGELYVPLRATWPKPRPDDDYDFIGDPSPETHNIAVLDSLLDQWLDEKSSTDWLRLVGGGPGSGKSTTLKALARRMADKPDWRPLLIPLQHIDLKRDLRDAINSYFVETSDSPFLQPPLTRQTVEDGTPMCLIFDGLDEIVAPGEAAREVVGDFSHKLSTLIAAIDGEGRRLVKVVVSGRLPAFQAARKYLTTAAHTAVETRGYTGYPSHEKTVDQVWFIDQRPLWWQNYATLMHVNVDVPEALSNYRLASLTHEPLLCYLLALSGYASEHWELAADNRNRIYAALMGSVYDRGWGDGLQKRQGAGRTLSRADFNKLMETIALAAWLGGDARVASEENFDRAVIIMGAQDAWDTFTAENGTDVANLAMNFYLKSSEKKLRGFEFTHKSFGEYLVSRALLHVAEETAVEARRRTDNALRDWYSATSTGVVTVELMSFMTDGLRLQLANDDGEKSKKQISEFKAMLTKLLSVVNEEGFTSDYSQASWRLLEAMQHNAEVALWLVVNSCAKALDRSGYASEALVKVEWESEVSLARIIRRLSIDTDSSIFPLLLSHLDIEHQSIFDLVLHRVSFDGAKLKNAVFARVDFLSCSFRAADLTDVRFFSSKIRDGDFEDAICEGVVLQDTQLMSTEVDISEPRSIIASVASIVRMDTAIIEELGNDLYLLSHGPETRKQAVELLNSRIKAIEGLTEVAQKNLVADWPEINDDPDEA